MEKKTLFKTRARENFYFTLHLCAQIAETLERFKIVKQCRENLYTKRYIDRQLN